MAVKLEAPLGKVAYINARLIDPASNLDCEKGIVITDGELIEDFGQDLTVPEGATVVDCKGKVLCPGLVDMRVQLREPGEEHKGTLRSAGQSATAGGITTMVCLPNTHPVIDDMSVVEFVARRARLIGLAKVYPYGAATKGLKGEELAEIGTLAEAGAVAFTDGIRPIADSQTLRKALSYAACFDLLIVQHAEDISLSANGQMNAGETSVRLGLSGIPREAEIIMVERDIRILKMSGGRLHFAHLSTSDAIDAVRRAKAEGLNVTCDTAPPYFSLNETAVGEYRTFSKLSPPLRDESDRQAVIEGIQDGTIDAIASDHAPQDEESKRVPFALAEFGGVGLETLLSISLELYHNGFMSLIDILRPLTERPAKILRLPCGRLEKGLPADLTLFDPDKGWKVDEYSLLSLSKNTPFDGRPVQGAVLRTVVDGRTVYLRDK